METPWKRVRATRSHLQEIEFSTLPGAKKQVNSGRHWFSKGDNTLGVYLVDNKTSQGESFRIVLTEWMRTVAQGMHTPPGLLAAWQIDLGPAKLWLMRLDDWLAQESYVSELRRENDELKKDLQNAKNEIKNLRRNNRRA
jgi:hypothetical protein